MTNLEMIQKHLAEQLESKSNLTDELARVLGLAQDILVAEGYGYSNIGVLVSQTLEKYRKQEASQ